MPDEKKLDPFKPPEPNIPGVPPAAKKSVTATGPQIGKSKLSAIPPLAWIIVAAAGVVIIGVGLAFHLIHAGSGETTVSHAAPLAVPSVAKPAKPKQALPVGPGVIATTQELKQTWSAKRFLFPDSVTGQTDAAMVVRLPRGEYWGFSLQAPFGKCELEYVSNLEVLRRDYQFNADHPMVVNPCDHTIYDLLRYGSSSAGLVRGDIVQGSGIRPPMAIEILERGSSVVAVRME
ncbi:MAG TPA: hypothetical protein VI216_11255 [Candidatus Acidoferrales bacterium]